MSTVTELLKIKQLRFGAAKANEQQALLNFLEEKRLLESYRKDTYSRNVTELANTARNMLLAMKKVEHSRKVAECAIITSQMEESELASMQENLVSSKSGRTSHVRHATSRQGRIPKTPE